jgi:thymidylate synthase
MLSYLNLLQDVYLNGEGHDDRTGVGTRSVFGRQWGHCLGDGFPLLTTKKMPFRWVAEELRWFLSGSTNEKDLQKVGVDIWKEWATEEQCAKFGRKEGDLGPVYGALWREFPIGESRYDDQRALTVMIGPDGQEHRRIATDQITWLDHLQLIQSELRETECVKPLGTLVIGFLVLDGDMVTGDKDR